MLEDQDLVRVTDQQVQGATGLINVFFFLIDVLVTGITLIDVLEDFRTEVLEPILGIQSADIEHNLLIAENLTNGIDIEELIISDVGEDVGSGPILPPFTAARFRLNVGDKTTRPGGKRIAGIGESRVAGNNYEPDGPGQAAVLVALAAPFDVVNPTSGDGVATPIVVGRNLDGSLDLTRFSLVLSAFGNPTIGSQVSRRGE